MRITSVIVPAAAIALAAVFSANAAEEKAAPPEAARVEKAAPASKPRKQSTRHDHSAFHKSGAPAMSRGGDPAPKPRAEEPGTKQKEAAKPTN